MSPGTIESSRRHNSDSCLPNTLLGHHQLDNKITSHAVIISHKMSPASIIHRVRQHISTEYSSLYIKRGKVSVGNVRSSVTLGVASSVANHVIMIIAGSWRYGDWRHVATGCTALVLTYTQCSQDTLLTTWYKWDRLLVMLTTAIHCVHNRTPPPEHVLKCSKSASFVQLQFNRMNICLF